MCQARCRHEAKEIPNYVLEQFRVLKDVPCFLLQTDYTGIMDLVKAMNARYSDRTEIQKRCQKTLSESVRPSSK